MESMSFMLRVKDALNSVLFRIGDTPVNLATVLVALLVILATFWSSRLLRKAVTRGLKKRGGNEGSIAALTGLLHYAVLFAGFGVALHTLGINLAALFTAGAVLAIGLGFAMQTLAQNFVSGIILLAERAIKPGDVLAVDGRVVKVKRLGIRSTQVVSRDGEDLIVPNSSLVQATVTNYTLREHTFRIWVKVGVAYGSDMQRVHETLVAAGEAFEPREDRPVEVNLTEFGNSSVNFTIGVWISDPWDQRPLKGALHRAVWDALKRNDITIAFPQLDVHFDQPPEIKAA